MTREEEREQHNGFGVIVGCGEAHKNNQVVTPYFDTPVASEESTLDGMVTSAFMKAPLGRSRLVLPLLFSLRLPPEEGPFCVDGAMLLRCSPVPTPLFAGVPRPRAVLSTLDRSPVGFVTAPLA